MLSQTPNGTTTYALRKSLDALLIEVNAIGAQLNAIEAGGGSSYPQLFSTDANTLEVYNGANPQTLNVYGTLVDANDFARLSFTYENFEGLEYCKILADADGREVPNVSIVATPRGAGAFSLQMPRPGTQLGYQAVDLGSERASDTEIASGDWSTRTGSSTSAHGDHAFVTGDGSAANGIDSFACGYLCNAEADYSFAGGYSASADKWGQKAHGGQLGQTSVLTACTNTSGTTPSEMTLGDTGDLCTLHLDTTWRFEVSVVARTNDNVDFATFKRYGLCYRGSSPGTAALVGAVLTDGTDIVSAGAVTWSVDVTVDGTDDYLKIMVSGSDTAPQQVYWFAKISLTEISDFK